MVRPPHCFGRLLCFIDHGVHDDGRRSRRHRLRRDDTASDIAVGICLVNCVSVFIDIERVASMVAALGNDHTFSAGRGNINIGGDGKGRRATAGADCGGMRFTPSRKTNFVRLFSGSLTSAGWAPADRQSCSWLLHQRARPALSASLGSSQRGLEPG